MFKPRTDGLDDAAAVQRIRELKNKVAFYQRKVDRWKTRCDKWKTRCDKTGRALETVRRLLPSPAIAETLIPARLEAARQRARHPDAVARHQALIRTAHRYAQAVEAYHAGRMPNAQRIRIGELAFWIPLDDQLPERVSRAKTQGLPWRAILSAREVSVGRVMLDIGANLGRTAIPRVVLGDIDIAYVAEPDPANYDCLVWSVLDNGLGGLVLPDQAAISCRDGEAELVRSRFVGGHVLRSPRTEGERQTTVSVPCYRLDAWVQRLNVELQDVSFVKVDVQGREPHVLRGAPQVLKHRHIAWQLEVDSGRLKRVGSRLDELFTLMETHFSWFLNLDKARTGPRMLPVEDLRRSLRHLDVKSSKTDLLLWR